MKLCLRASRRCLEVVLDQGETSDAVGRETKTDKTSSAGTSATTCTPGKNYMRQMLQAFDELPINIGITGKGNDSGKEGLEEQVLAGAAGLKLHEDWGCTPAAIDTCLRYE